MAKTSKELKQSIAETISMAFGEFETLGQEMADWGDNIEEKFSTTEKYERIREAQELLEGLSEPDVPDSLGKIEVTVPQIMKRRPSRADRLSNACIALDVVMDALEAVEGADNKDDAEALRAELDNEKSNAEGVEFPGMFG